MTIEYGYDKENPKPNAPPEDSIPIAFATVVPTTQDKFSTHPSENPSYNVTTENSALKASTISGTVRPPPGNTRLLGNLGRYPVVLTCQFCGINGETSVRDEFGLAVLVYYVILFLTGLIFLPPFACLPCCCVQFKDTVHQCRNCNRIVGKTAGFNECGLN
mmetsp:Transcript_37812/g.44039  ORF Transcript_37812/g.44039 Transcript_37812/m.44039 type:complete len:161 (-) Transcript_37812:108-590(-)